MGWLASLQNTLFYFFNKTGMLIFGNESQPTLASAVIGCIMGIIPIGIYNITY
jgi:hypothetical protein